MTKQEHELMILMFARMNEHIGIIEETLKSRGLWTGDDARAFSHAVHSDDEKISKFVTDARNTYVNWAKDLGIFPSSAS
jgi:hypothetical protein